MSRYKIRLFITMIALLVLPAATCGVSAAVQDLRDRVAVLEAESDSQAVVIDANGVEVGATVGISNEHRLGEIPTVALVSAELDC